MLLQYNQRDKRALDGYSIHFRGYLVYKSRFKWRHSLHFWLLTIVLQIMEVKTAIFLILAKMALKMVNAKEFDSGRTKSSMLGLVVFVATRLL